QPEIAATMATVTTATIDARSGPAIARPPPTLRRVSPGGRSLVPPVRDLEPHDEDDHRPEEDRQIDQHVAGVSQHEMDRERAHWFTAESSQRPRLVKPTITTSIQYWERVASETFLYRATARS